MADAQSTSDNRQSTIIKVLVVEDSPVVREFLVHLLTNAGIRVIGVVSDGEEAVRFVQRTRPDVVTMDIYMPRMNGIEATRRIMENNPVPIVIVSGNWDSKEVETTFRAIEAGALAIVQRPQGPAHPDHETMVKELVQTIRLMSEVKVVRRWPRSGPTAATAPVHQVGSAPAPARIEAVGIGASTGGPPALQTILSGIPRDFPAPILVVQHMAAGFLPGMVAWLGETSAIPLHMATAGETLLPGHAYFAPDGFHLGIETHGKIALTSEALEHGARPSVSYLFRSLARTCGRSAVGVLLTGMGNDGAEELKSLKDKGAITIAQSRDSCVVFGMPAAAIDLDAAVYVLSPEQIPATLAGMTKKRDRD